MNILVTGASGLIGSALGPRLAAAGHRVIQMRRSVPTDPAEAATWNPLTGEMNLAPSADLDAVVHLAGEPIAQRWITAAKARIRDSRVLGTRLLCEAVGRLPQPPKVMVCASATGFYGNRGEEMLTEITPPGTGFLADVCREWEAAAQPAADRGIRVVLLRLGIVLAPQGGALTKMLPVFRLGLGGPVGSGRQYWSWIALEDLIEVIHCALNNERLEGPVNAVSPNPVTNGEFARTLAAVLRRPAFLRVPTFAVKIALGQMGEEALLASARVLPARLADCGFMFRFKALEGALRQILGT